MPEEGVAHPAGRRVTGVTSLRSRPRNGRRRRGLVGDTEWTLISRCTQKTLGLCGWGDSSREPRRQVGLGRRPPISTRPVAAALGSDQSDNDHDGEHNKGE